MSIQFFFNLKNRRFLYKIHIFSEQKILNLLAITQRSFKQIVNANFNCKFKLFGTLKMWHFPIQFYVFKPNDTRNKLLSFFCLYVFFYSIYNKVHFLPKSLICFSKLSFSSWEEMLAKCMPWNRQYWAALYQFA